MKRTPLALVLLALVLPAAAQKINPGALPRAGSVDERFQSYNIEMVEVTGGRFWRPYASKPTAPEPTSANQPAGMSASLYEYRPPIDLSNARLRKLAAALGPAYLRVSGTWANTTFFQDSDGPAPSTPPEGFKAVLTAAQWKGVLDFSQAVNAPIVTSFAFGAGTRDASGVWTPAQADKILSFTKAKGGRIAAAEFMNEPTFAAMGGGPANYDAKAYARDLAVFKPFLKEKSPDTILLGPGGSGEGGALVPPGMKLISSDDILAATGPAFDVIDYHSYAAVSARCAQGPAAAAGIKPENALSEEWLSQAAKIEGFYAALRDKYEPGTPIWNTETAEAACGGDRFASTFLDTFRYLNQLGTLARQGVQVNMHNTLAASDYGLLDEKTYEPRPDYWAALAWHRMMGSTVLDAGANPKPGVYVYAHCLQGQAGGVALLAINASQTTPARLELANASERYSMTAPDLQSGKVLLNGSVLALGAGDELPVFRGKPTVAGPVELAPESITFFGVPGANNPACR
ncbi:hypothetical protein DYQ86_10280 [Acidobacteria bacterium AB60]|nr:hypothetical protein DYQ86_10280 [Acidobacteria bacterium AB60]